MKVLIISFLFLCSIFAKANNRENVIYGDDNRKDIYDSTNSLYKKLAESTAAMIPSGQLTIEGDNYKISSGTLKDDGVCEDERFSSQPTAALCSGFLVGHNLLISAGHCITNQDDCDSHSWVFDYALKEKNSNPILVSKQNVYHCSKIISRVKDDITLNDYSLIQLDRDVENREPLNYRVKGKIELNQEVLVIGNPSGLPTKIADGAFVRNNNNKYFFQTNLDTFGGNSGSAVFNAKTGLIEGILVRGDTDYKWDSSSFCNRVNKCPMDGCRGEDVTRITVIKGLKNNVWEK